MLEEELRYMIKLLLFSSAHGAKIASLDDFNERDYNSERTIGYLMSRLNLCHSVFNHMLEFINTSSLFEELDLEEEEEEKTEYSGEKSENTNQTEPTEEEGLPLYSGAI